MEETRTGGSRYGQQRPAADAASVAVSSSGPLQFGAPSPLFDIGPKNDGSGLLGRDYDVMPDGSRFVVRKSGPTPRSKFAVILNWPALLEKR